MRHLLVLVLLAAACGSTSPPPSQPAAEEAPAEEEMSDEEARELIESGEYQPEECDDFCATGCNEVEDYDGCMADCGCAEE